MVMICAKNRPHSSRQWLGSSLKASAQRPSFSRSSDASLWSLSAAISTCRDTADANHQANGKSIAAVQRKLNCFTSIAASHQDHHQTWWRKWDKIHQSLTTNSCETAIQKKKLPALQPRCPPPVLFWPPPKKNSPWVVTSSRRHLQDSKHSTWCSQSLGSCRATTQDGTLPETNSKFTPENWWLYY